MSERAEAGRKILRRILGDETFERRAGNTNSFNRTMRELTDEYCFGEVWTREGLDARMRSMLTLAMLATMGRENEIQIHSVGAINNGCTVEDIEEVMLMVAIYAGIPAGIAGLRTAETALRAKGLLKD